MLMLLPYDMTQRPPALMIDCTLVNPMLDREKQEKGKIDTGASRTMIPESCTNKDNLALVQARWLTGRDYAGQQRLHRSFVVDIEIDGITFDGIEVASCPRQNVLIGRDILNRFNVFLYGPRLEFEIKKP
jgi:predicted aspartyl protease